MQQLIHATISYGLSATRQRQHLSGTTVEMLCSSGVDHSVHVMTGSTFVPYHQSKSPTYCSGQCVRNLCLVHSDRTFPTIQSPFYYISCRISNLFLLYLFLRVLVFCVPLPNSQFANLFRYLLLFIILLCFLVIILSTVNQGKRNRTARNISHDDVIKWKHFSRHRPFVRGIHRSPMYSPHKSQWHLALMFSFICAWINGWVNNREDGDLRRHRTHYDVIVMLFLKMAPKADSFIVVYVFESTCSNSPRVIAIRH